MLSRLSGYLALLGALAATATPLVRDKSPVSVPFTRKFTFTNGSTVPDMDRVRITNLMCGCNNRCSNDAKTLVKEKLSAAATVFNTDATNGAVEYTMTVGVGSPATDYTLIVDTGSSNTWVGANQAYTQTSTSTSTGQTVEVTYGSGEFEGTEYTDTVTIADGLAITGQSIGVASSSSGFSGVDGILGLGPEDLTCGTLTTDESACIPTVVQNAYSQGLISAQELGISFAPITGSSGSDTNGVLTFGGADSSCTPVPSPTATSRRPSRPETTSAYPDRSYGSETLFSNEAGIVDTGTTLIYIPSSAYNRYVSATGATLDDNTGLLRLSTSQYNNLKDMTFTIGGTEYTFTANAQIWPRSLNTAIGGTTDYVYLVVSDMGSSGENGLEFINGMTWLERYYFVYDSGASQVGFATTQYTDATTN
ncbi:acid protease [Fomitopsis serialis]|uniref:acid protease n=1 Tax=Fomitopsis serialis TaxID=139415 RepID=UPI00200825BD|nr:acid protease [Neoantrodia serialis]KAH9921806.1 acid protease [Neoantrodia serialis]